MKGYWKRDNKDHKMRQVYKTTGDTGRVEGTGVNCLFPPKNPGQEIKPESNRFKTNDRKSCIAHCMFRLQNFLL